MQTERTIQLLTGLSEVDLAKDTIPKPVGLGSRVGCEGDSVRSLFGTCPLGVRHLFRLPNVDTLDQR